MPTKCIACGKPIDVHQQVRGGTCDNVACRVTVVKRRIAREHAEHDARLTSIAKAHLRTMLEDRQERAADVPMVVIPGGAATMAPVPANRREAFRESLSRAIAASEQAEPDEIVADSSPPSATLAAGCGTCRGWCCRNGGDSAYVDASTIRRVRSQRPDLGQDELVALYMDALPELIVEGSCVMHGDQGCTLPREVRGNICNAYYCLPMRDWIGRREAAPEPLTAVIILHEDRVVRSALIEDK